MVTIRKYVITDKTSGAVLQTYQWEDDRDFPTEIVLGENEELLTTLVDDEIDIYNTYDSKNNEFYILDVSDTESQINDIKTQLSNLELVLPEFQEDTWTAIGIDEIKLPQIWQGRLKQKRDLRDQLRKLTT